MKINHVFPIAASFIAMAVTTHAAQTYSGNGATGFGGPVGTGSLSISDSAGGMTITLNRGAGSLNDDLVLYLDTQAGGFSDTSSFSDNGDGGRTAISGFNGGNPSRTVDSFAAGFGADYAISIENGFIGVFGLASGGNNSLNYLFGQGQSGNPNDPSYSITITAAQMSQIGLTAGSGQTFDFVGSLDSESAYRANETIGPSVTFPANGSDPNAGFNGSQVFTGDDAYTLVTAPDTGSTLLLLGTGLASLLVLGRRLSFLA
jgi:hypothetical protein